MSSQGNSADQGDSWWPSESEKFSGLSREVMKDLAPVRRQDSYFHYTSSAGLKGIVEENTLHFSDTKFQNDGSERRWGLEVFREVVDGMSSTLADKVKAFLRGMYETENRMSEDFRNVIFCMSGEGNLLNQWRDYGKDVVPYCIEFDANYFLEDQGASFAPGNIRMIYDHSMQKNMIRELISRIFDLMQSSWDEAGDEDLRRMSARASFQAGHLLETFKHPAFEAEQESRLNISHFSLKKAGVQPKFRPATLGLLPYYEWKPGTKLAIKSVRVGPSPHSDASVDALKLFLDHNGIDADATVSAIPIRR